MELPISAMTGCSCPTTGGGCWTSQAAPRRPQAAAGPPQATPGNRPVSAKIEIGTTKSSLFIVVSV